MAHLQALKAELDNDPLTRGYAAMTDGQAADSLNTIDRTASRVVQSKEVLSWAGSNGRAARVRRAAQDSTSDIAAQSIAIVADLLVSRDNTALDIGNPDHVAMIQGLVAVGVLTASDQTDLTALATHVISRATELSLGVVRAGEVAEARL